MLEAKALVEGRGTDQEAALCPQVPNGLQAFVDQGLSDASPLMGRQHGDGTKAEPPAVLSADLTR